MDLDQDACYRAFQMRDARFDGAVFAGVKTTGVYCRPVCPARTPMRRNVDFYPSAAAAQGAGFRPCLRCRPESSPDLGAWRGTSNTVSRGLRLIETGALDDGDVDGLAARLGVGERQLRRLFRVHLGASPVAVAQTRRVLLAKQLIHETRLTMAQVALAAGFGSVRRFNETFQQLFGRPPAALRRQGGSDAPAGGAISVKLAYRPPYDWAAMAGFLAARAIAGVEAVAAGGYARTFCIDGTQGTVLVEPGDGDHLRVSVNSPNLKVLTTVIARVRRVFDLGTDPGVIAAHLSEDPRLAPLVAARPGLRAPGAWDGFELAVRAVLGQQVTIGAARNLGGKLTQAFGTGLERPDQGHAELTAVFPAPEQLVGQDIAVIGMPGARARAIEGLARSTLADPWLFDQRAHIDEAVARLRALPGIGEWTAHYIALRALREPDAFPPADVGLMRALADPDGRRPSPSDLLTQAERWRPWRAYAAQHLWAADADRQETSDDKAA